MKIPHSSQRPGGPMEINMTPMIDMVFLLIVYFVWTSGDLALEMLLPSRLVEQSGTAAANDVPPPEADFDPVVVRIAGEEGSVTWRVNDVPQGSLAELQGVLARLAKIKVDAPVILDPEGAVPLGNVIDVYDLARKLGFEKVNFAAPNAALP